MYIVPQEKCCGVYNWTDYATIPWQKNATGTPLVVPQSCCAQVANASFPPTYSSFVDLIGCRNGIPSAISQQVRLCEFKLLSAVFQGFS